jgi:hypothetical protein
MNDIMINNCIFIDPKGNNKVICETNISVIEIMDGPTTLYSIRLDSVFYDIDGIRVDIKRYNHVSHPLFYTSHNLEGFNMEGFSIIKNDMTTSMIHVLMMDDDELAIISGTMTPRDYRRNILLSLERLFE